ncbi:hypothetical protein [Sorangium sp. So ce233]|uniref:hypothetical protein n=1 Tax=Sorangium sp. So ce233 TaxID=3133290 RepID=UPI003F61A1A7
MNKKSRDDDSLSRTAPNGSPIANEPEIGTAPTWDQRTLDTRDLGGDLSTIAALCSLRAGEYLLDGVIAEGGFGVVYRAVHATRGTPAAVKVMHADLTSRNDVVLRFRREVDAPTGNPPKYHKTLRDPATGKEIEGRTIEVPWTKDQRHGVIDIAGLAPNVQVSMRRSTMTSAPFALQMIEGVQKVRFTQKTASPTA